MEKDELIHVDPSTGLTIGIFAASKQGKTELIKWIWKKYFRKTHITIVCSPTSPAKIYDIFKKDCIITQYTRVFRQLLEHIHYIQSHTQSAFKFLFILDDCTATRENVALREMFLTLRNLNISTILSLQGCTLMNRHNRSSMNYGFFGRFLGSDGIRQVIDNFLDGIFPHSMKKVDRIDAYAKSTKDHHFIFRDMLDGDKYCLFKLNLSKK
jgi:hypothetical protein